MNESPCFGGEDSGHKSERLSANDDESEKLYQPTETLETSHKLNEEAK